MGTGHIIMSTGRVLPQRANILPEMHFICKILNKLTWCIRNQVYQKRKKVRTEKGGMGRLWRGRH